RVSLRRTLVNHGCVRQLAETPESSRLRALNLRDNSLSDPGVTALAGSPHLRNLTDLDLGYVKITTAGVSALAGSPLMPRLTRLSLASNFHNVPGAAEVIAASPHRLAELDLSHVEIGDAGAVALANSPASA